MFKTGTAKNGTPSTEISSIYTLLNKLLDVKSNSYVLKKGKIISGHKNHKKQGNVSLTFAAPVMINGKRGNVAVCVLYGKDYVHSCRVLTPEGETFELIKIKDAETTTTDRSNKSYGDSYIISASNDSLCNLDENVKKSYEIADEEYMSAVESGDVDVRRKGQIAESQLYNWNIKKMQPWTVEAMTRRLILPMSHQLHQQ